ncbi:MAG: threonine synthase [Clostridiales bacterium]|nr:threonine synthase [Clostridiales bacterium]
MRFISTRGGSAVNGSAAAIMTGLAPDGGLFVPEELPRISREDLTALTEMTYGERAVFLLRLLFDDFTSDEIQSCVLAAYGPHFDDRAIAPVRTITDRLFMLELWHGPTGAFKDMALQLLPRLMAAARSAAGRSDTSLILVATSGDTGKAALEGFRDVPGTRIVAYYPQTGVSPMQQLQMTTQQGSNAHVVAVYGNFDDAQTGVKALFSDRERALELADMGYSLSSANSINYGRLAPQIVYYFSAWCDLAGQGAIAADEPVDFVVPTGNFGNILAGWYAKRMGLPVGRLVCASNRNHILSDFLGGGRYDTRRPFHQTLSPSMDILVSSNLERLLFEASGRDAAQVAAWMQALSRDGSYTIPARTLGHIREDFEGGWADERQTRAAIAEAWRKRRILIDPHTAVAMHVQARRRRSGRAAVVVSTASAYKFCGDVYAVLTGRTAPADPFAQCDALWEATGIEPPRWLRTLRELPVIHRQSVYPQHMGEALLRMLDMAGQ